MKRKTRKEWETEFITHFVLLRDYFWEQNEEDLVNEKCTVIENLLIGYFGDRISRIPFSMPSPFMNCEAMTQYLNDVVLDYIKDEHYDLLTLDWKQHFILQNDNLQI